MAEERAGAELRRIARKLTNTERDHLTAEAIARAVGRLRGFGLAADDIAAALAFRAVRLLLESREPSEVAVWLAELADELDPADDEDDDGEAAAGQASAARAALDLVQRRDRWKEEERSAWALPLASRRADGRGHRRPGFAAAVAADTGLSKATVNRRLRRALAIAGDVMAEIHGTRWDRGSTLDLLQPLAHQQQRAAVELLVAGAAKSVREARDLVLGGQGRGVVKSLPPPAR